MYTLTNTSLTYHTPSLTHPTQPESHTHCTHTHTHTISLTHTLSPRLGTGHRKTTETELARDAALQGRKRLGWDTDPFKE